MWQDASGPRGAGKSQQGPSDLGQHQNLEIWPFTVLEQLSRAQLLCLSISLLQLGGGDGGKVSVAHLWI